MQTLHPCKHGHVKRSAPWTLMTTTMLTIWLEISVLDGAPVLSAVGYARARLHNSHGPTPCHSWTKSHRSARSTGPPHLYTAERLKGMHLGEAEETTLVTSMHALSFAAQEIWFKKNGIVTELLVLLKWKSSALLGVKEKDGKFWAVV